MKAVSAASSPTHGSARALLEQIEGAIISGDAAAIRAALASCAVGTVSGEITAQDADEVVRAGRLGYKAIRAAATSEKQRALDQATSVALPSDRFKGLDQSNLGSQLLAAGVPPKSRTRKRLA